MKESIQQYAPFVAGAHETFVFDERGKELSREKIRETMKEKTRGCETGLHDCTVYQNAIRVGDSLVSTIYGELYRVGYVYYDDENDCRIIFDKPQVLSIDGPSALTQSEIYRLGLKLHN